WREKNKARRVFPPRLLLLAHSICCGTYGIQPTRILPCNRCCNGPGLNFCGTRFLRHTQQKLAAAKVNGSRPVAHTENSLLAKACDRLIFESQLTPRLHTGLYRRAVANIIVNCTPTRRSLGSDHLNFLAA